MARPPWPTIVDDDGTGLTGTPFNLAFFNTVKAYINKNLQLLNLTELTISGGVVTITEAFHIIDTEGDAASDDLDTINGGSTGDILVIRPAHDARTVVVKHNTGNIWLKGQADVSLDDIRDCLMLIRDATKWMDLGAGGGGGADPEKVKLPDPEVADFATPTVHNKSSETTGGEAANSVDDDTGTFWRPDGLILNQQAGDYEYHLSIDANWYQRGGQRITLTGQNLSYVRFKLKKVGSPSGNVNCRVRRTSDDGIIETSATVYTANELSTSYEWKEFALTCSPNEQVYILVEPSGGDYSNYIDAYLSTSDVCDGCHVMYQTGPGYTVNSTFDSTIILAYSETTPWISWDIGSLKFLGGCRIYWGSEVGYRPTEYKIYTSPNASDWTEVIHETGAAPGSAWKTYQWYVKYARYFKLAVITPGASGVKVYEADGYSLAQTATTARHGHGGL